MITTNSSSPSFTPRVSSFTDPFRAPALAVRRVFFFGLVLLTTLAGANIMFDILRANDLTMIETLILLLFVITFGWLAMSFWTAMIGFVLQILKRDPISLRPSKLQKNALSTPITTRTAVVMPIYNEEPCQVLAGLEATFRSLAHAGNIEYFDFFLLSDTTDPEIAAAEHAGWAALCRRLNAEGKLFYRRRDRNIGRKAGNITDFCCRWGQRYDFMVVLDADSIMSGETILALVRAIQASPRAGIIQTVPMPIGQQTMFGRFIQFASRLYSPMLATGLSFWQVGEANYWGHNAIIRNAPFMKHCGLPVLPGTPPLGGEILSHDFVEAALMRRGNWRVYLRPDLEGSYEGVPANMLDFAKRDRRWAQGNLQHLKLLTMRGLHPLSRLHLLLGALAYGSSLIWLLLLILSTADAFSRALWPHDFFGSGYQLFPDWPIAKTGEIFSLLAVTIAMLLLPKIGGVLLCLINSKRRSAFGGAIRVFASALVEVLFSIFIAPVMMLFHAYFVLTILSGHNVSWTAQVRSDRSLGAREVVRYVIIPTILSVCWGASAFFYAPQFFWWLTPILLGLGLALPLIMWSSRTNTGNALRRWGLFLTPEELDAPVELSMARSALADPISTTPPTSSSLPPSIPPEASGEMQPQWLETIFSWRQKSGWDASQSAT